MQTAAAVRLHEVAKACQVAGLQVSLSESRGHIAVSQIVVEKQARGSGLGTAAM